MWLIHQNIPVRISKFFKAIIPKTTYEWKGFKSIKSNVINHQIIYQLYDGDTIITFYKKSNLNVFNRLENVQDATQLLQLKSNIMPKRLANAYANENHDFKVYLADEFIFVVYSKDNRSHKDSWTWDILLYDTKNKSWSKYSIAPYKSFGGIYGFHYLRKCRKVIFAIGNPIFSDEIFHRGHSERRGFQLNDFYFISLDKPKNDLNSYGFVYIDSHLEKYIENQYDYEQILQKTIDYTVDANNGIIYVICKIKFRFNGEYKVVILSLEYDMCTDNGIRSMKSFGIELPIPIIEDLSHSEDILLYLSYKRLRDKGMPKYLPMHISSEFYDFMSNKLFHADMIFSSHSKPLVRDRHFNRVCNVLSEIETLRVASHLPLQEDVITMRSGYNNKVLAVLLICDLSSVQRLNL
jgi:hypothetical protein